MRVVVMGDDDFINDWDLQAVVRSCSFPHAEEEAGAPAAAPASAQNQVARAAVAKQAPGASARYDLEYLDLDHNKPFLLPAGSSSSRAARGEDDGNSHKMMLYFPAVATAASTSGAQPRLPPGRKPGIRSPRPKRSKKSQLKKLVCEVPVVADGGVSSDLWAWRKYGQKPIKGSPYPRGYYKCSSMKGCMARKMVERSPAKPGMLIVTYMAEHCHPVPTQLNALAGSTRHKSAPPADDDRPTTTASPRGHEDPEVCKVAGGGVAKCEDDDGNEASAMADDDSGEFWEEGMRLELDEFLAPMDDEVFDHVFDDGVLGRGLKL
ncbi:hypothetical protein GUJ93_ZPchr0001g32749 [Zizania palustris]|uniref:WRKY domain-containing protein n=1 Tax=Zizania palustris TaxID=103762 RepID=A0A8J5VUC7_ZIZPA|nr:hypothetical protein GUJ93_ZPchr0001g32749 [Zizania palustris]